MALIPSLAVAEAEKKSDVHVNFTDLALWSKNSSKGEFFNSANLTLNSNLFFEDVNLKIPGKVTLTYNLFGLDNDSQLNSSENWQGGVGSYLPGALAMNDIADFQLSNLTWDSSWADNKLYTSIGRLNARRYFYYNICSLGALCLDPVKTATGSLPMPYGYWGGYFKYNLTDDFYIHAGAFEVNSNDFVEEKNGLDFSLNHGNGENYIYSAGYNLPEKRGKAELTYSENKSDNRNALTGQTYTQINSYNARFNYKFDPEQRYEVAGTYSYIDQENWVYKSYWELGLNCKDCLLGQKLGLRSGQSTLNDDFYSYTQTLNGNQHKTTTFVSIDTEFAYERVSVAPFVQFIWNPDNYYKSQGDSFDENLIVGALFKAKLY
ncbi:porin [Acinetobacter chengduensis]|uniref:Porin n=2 Tax=Acinetobacter chengduensis TaxID=2420890 RepID=A0ABX9TVR4_9GAMM|nr:porin [Acinetobacter chengduensis]